MGPVTFVLLLLMKITMACTFKAQTGSWISKKSAYKEKKGIKWGTIATLLVSALCNTASFMALTYAWSYAQHGSLNSGVVSILTAFIAIYNVGAFFCSFGEKPNSLQTSGLFVLSVSLVFLAIDVYKRSKEPEIEKDHEEEHFLK